MVESSRFCDTTAESLFPNSTPDACRQLVGKALVLNGNVQRLPRAIIVVFKDDVSRELSKGCGFSPTQTLWLS